MKTKIHSTAFFSQRKSRVPKQIQFAFLVCLLIIAISCEKSNSSDVVFKATINGASQTPPNSSVATGAATLTYNKDTKIFSIVVTFSGLTSTIAHIHSAPVGVVGDVIFPFPSPIKSPINYTSPVLTASQDSALNADLFYVNIHSATFPDGEIRGQLIKQ